MCHFIFKQLIFLKLMNFFTVDQFFKFINLSFFYLNLLFILISESLELYIKFHNFISFGIVELC